MYVTAHRGFGERYPENTVGAVKRAAEDADAVEIDVRRCGSGELVVIHYDHVEPITDGHGDVDELSISELAALSVDGSNEGVPQLDAALKALPPDTDVNIELKELGLAADVLEAIDAVENDVLISALDVHVHALWEVQTLDESVPLACNLSARPKEDVEVAELIGCKEVNPVWATALVTDVIDRIHERNMDVHAWPVGSRLVAEALRRRGVNGLIARAPEYARPLSESVDLDGMLSRLARSN